MTRSPAMPRRAAAPFTEGAGVLEVVGVGFVAFTVTENADSEALPPLPSLTLMTMPEVVPASAAAGVPDSRPVDVLKLAHDGRFAMANVSVSLSGSDAVGVKPYAAPEFTEVTGVPLIVGARFGAADTVSVNAGSDAPPPLPSLTLITMPACVPAAVGVPESRQVLVEKLAQLGRLAMEKERASPSASLAVGWVAPDWRAAVVAGPAWWRRAAGHWRRCHR